MALDIDVGVVLSQVWSHISSHMLTLESVANVRFIYCVSQSAQVAVNKICASS